MFYRMSFCTWVRIDKQAIYSVLHINKCNIILRPELQLIKRSSSKHDK